MCAHARQLVRCSRVARGEVCGPRAGSWNHASCYPCHWPCHAANKPVKRRTLPASGILVLALPAFHERYPGIQIDMGVSDRAVDIIGENVDCVVRGGELADQVIMVRQVGDLQLGVYAAPGYLERAGIALHPKKLEDTHHRVVGFVGARRKVLSVCDAFRQRERQKVQGRHVFSVDDGNAYLAAGLAGLGVLWLPDYMSKAPVASGELVPLFKGWRLDPMPLYLAFPPNRHVSAKLRVFIEWVVELMAEHAPVSY